MRTIVLCVVAIVVLLLTVSYCFAVCKGDWNISSKTWMNPRALNLQVFVAGIWTNLAELIKGLTPNAISMVLPFLWKKSADPALAQQTPTAVPLPTPTGVFGAPQPPTRVFGLGPLLDTIHQTLTNPSQSTIIALTGAAGIGKTTAAAAYVKQYGAKWERVVWLHMANPSATTQDLAELAVHLGVAPDEAPIDERVKAAKAFLRGQPNLLLVLDNVVDVSSAEKLVGEFRTAKALVTLRSPNLPQTFHPIAVPELDAGSAAELFLFATGRLGPNQSLADAKPDDVKAAHEVHKLLGRHPQMLKQAGAFCRTMGWSPERFPAEWTKTKHALLKHSPTPKGAEVREDLWALVIASYEELRKKNPAAAQLVSAMAWLDPDRTSRDVFEWMPEVWPNPLSSAIQDLASYHSLLTAAFESALVEERMAEFEQAAGMLSSSALAMHRSFQEVLRLGKDFVSGSLEIEAVFDAVRRLFMNENLKNPSVWPMLRNCLPSSLALLDFAKATGWQTEVCSALANQTGALLESQGEFAGAALEYSEAERIARIVFGEQHPLVATTLSNVGSVLHEQGDYLGSLAKFRDAERIDRRIFGPIHHEVAADLNNIGAALLKIGDLDGAQAAFEGAESIYRRVYGDEHPSVSMCCSNIGNVLHDKGDLDGAYAKLLDAERVTRNVLGDRHPRVAVCVQNIGGVLQDQGNLESALERFTESARIYREAFGENHPSVASALNNLGTVMFGLGQLDDALRSCRSAERIDRRVLGDRHPSVARDINNVGSVQLAQGDLVGAFASFEEAEQIDRETLGDDHPSVATDVNNIGTVLEMERKHALARGRYADALSILLRSHGAEAINTPTAAMNLARVGGDPLAIAEQIGGEEMKQALRRAMDKK